MHISIIYKSTRGNIKWQRKIMEHYDIITSIIYSGLQRTPPFLSSAPPTLLSLLPFFSLFLSVPFPCPLSLSLSLSLCLCSLSLQLITLWLIVPCLKLRKCLEHTLSNSFFPPSLLFLDLVRIVCT